MSLEDGVAPLVDLVADLEAGGNEVTGLVQHGGEWVVVSRPAPKRARETR